MQIFIPKSLQYLAEKLLKNLGQPLYLVGGMVRDVVAGFQTGEDFDLAATVLPEVLCQQLMAIDEDERTEITFKIKAIYKRTGTVQFSDGIYTFEYTTFRKDSYSQGRHSPTGIEFTTDIMQDALRRDFTCNALYYDILAKKLVDPLNGVADIEQKLLKTTREPEIVFGEDALRLMRLARFAGILGFEAELSTIFAAKFNAAAIQQIVPERIFAELFAILHADSKYGIVDGHYIGLKVLESTDILSYILPELALGKGITQRADFHAHDVLEHALRTCRYADNSIRFAALLHDIGKATVWREKGVFSGHDRVGAELVENVLRRLKAPKYLIEECTQLTAMHMFDLDGSLPEEKIRRFFVENFALLGKLFALRQADFSAGKDNLEKCPTVIKWEKILEKMRAEGVPFSIKELKIDGNMLKNIAATDRDIGKILEKLLMYCCLDGKRNERDILLKQARIFAAE